MYSAICRWLNCIATIVSCALADYGFTKLIELFEAIPLTVEITEDADGERLLQLTDCERLKVLGSQIESLIQSTRKASLPLAQMEDFYRKQFGYPLRPDDYGESNVIQVLKKLPQLLRVESGPPKPSTPPAATGGSSEETSTRSGHYIIYFSFLFVKNYH